MKTTWLNFPLWLVVALGLAIAPALRTHADSDNSRGKKQTENRDEKKNDKQDGNGKGDDKADSKGGGKHDDDGKGEGKGDDDDDDQGGRKVTICHKGHTIEVSRNALKAHLEHGDTLGSCEVTPSKNR